ncbi:hypothetical protein GCM10009841_14660 [Microlunatus panaciterrae]|uniref:Ryanodine receptor Ryr domain-containing protein n=1 Tax=Microlunatus panaciterrae TaxID=400768 RepID=A0ABS2RPC5_9ACTN|nr:RyR domain-containing protein [Microlunatus panaciterrae]MBM7800026.1 hypothetical protein [Microlunatus panaciterrae]
MSAADRRPLQPARGQLRREQTLAGPNLLAAVLLAGYLAGLVALVLAVVLPVEAVREWPGLLSGYGDPTAWWPSLAQSLLAIGAYLVIWLPRRGQRRGYSLIATSTLVATILVLGMVSYWGCTAGRSPFWTPLVWTISLSFGNAEQPFGTRNLPGCPAQIPQAIQVAELFAKSIVALAATGVVAAVFRAQVDRIRIRLAPALVVVSGLEEASVALLRRARGDLQFGETLAVLTDNDADPLVSTARSIRARAVTVNFDRPAELRSLLTSGGRFKIRTLYLIAADASLNAQRAELVSAIAAAARPPSSRLPPRLVLRIDDPWQAEYWRRTNSYRVAQPAEGADGTTTWISDALSIYEVTASMILTRMEQLGWDRLVVIGQSPLALALCAELAQRNREQAVLDTARAVPLTTGPGSLHREVVLMGATAATLYEQHRLRQERFGNSAQLATLRVLGQLPTAENLADALRGSAQPVVILTERPADVSAQFGTSLAARFPAWTIFDPKPGHEGLSPEPAMERLYPYGLTLEPSDRVAIDSWERAARIVHELYLLKFATPPDPKQQAHVSWDRLSPFLRGSNIRLVTNTLASAERLGRTWGAAAGESEEDLDFSPEEVEQLARLEHESWMRYYLDSGWRQAAVRDDSRRRHTALLPWEELDDKNRSRARDNVMDTVAILRGLGYRSRPVRTTPVQPDSSLRWRAVRRVGEVTAEQVEQAWTWRNGNGEVLRASPGDWRLSDGKGGIWSVAPAVFETSYEHVDGQRWRRTGVVQARPAIDGEVVASMEGAETARAGDWVIRGTKGEHYVITQEHYAANYESVDAG